MGLPFHPQPKPKSRLQDKTAQKKQDDANERAFKKAVWARDGGHCRHCRRKVVKTIERIPERGEVHHLHGRTGRLRFEDRAALLLCLACHEPVTGRVGERWIAEGTKTFRLAGEEYIDARAVVRFRRVA